MVVILEQQRSMTTIQRVERLQLVETLLSLKVDLATLNVSRLYATEGAVFGLNSLYGQGQNDDKTPLIYLIFNIPAFLGPARSAENAPPITAIDAATVSEEFSPQAGGNSPHIYSFLPALRRSPSRRLWSRQPRPLP
jgi:hypothetical protein